MWIFDCMEVGTLNPLVVQGSTVVAFNYFPLRLLIFVYSQIIPSLFRSHEGTFRCQHFKVLLGVENGLEDMGRGKGKLGRSESGMDIYTLPNVKQIASGKQPHSTGRSAPCSVTTWRGGIGRVGGRSKREGIRGYMYTYS